MHHNIMVHMEFICQRCGEKGYLEQRRKGSIVYTTPPSELRRRKEEGEEVIWGTRNTSRPSASTGPAFPGLRIGRGSKGTS
jgi:hypothetical protein